MAEYIYTTKRQMLMDERKALATALASAIAGLQGLLSGEIQSYNLGHYSISRNKLDLDKLQSWIDSARIRIDEIDCILTGRSPRKVSHCVYMNPQNMRWGI